MSQGKGIKADLSNQNSSYLTRLGQGHRNSMIAKTGAMSGANILTDNMSGGNVHNRKQTIQHNFSMSGLDASDELTTGYKGSPELMRDPSVQMDL